MLVGVDPRKANYDALFLDSYGKDERIDDILYFLEDRFELLVKRFGDPKDILVSIELEELIDWACTSGQKHPTRSNELGARRQRVGGAVGRAKGTKEKPLHKSTKDLLGRVLVTVAIDHHNLTTKQNAAKVAKEIKHYGDELGFSLDDQILVKLIKAGFDQIDDRIKDEMTIMPDEK